MSEEVKTFRYGFNFDVDSQPSDIFIQRGIFDQVPQRLRDLNISSEYAIVTDSNLKQYSKSLYDGMRHVGLNVSHPIQIPAGEGSKNFTNVVEIANQLSAREHGRDTTLVALGGGMVGDITGFVASIYKRGVPFVQVSTSLLAQVDSGIGGKTGIDIEGGKNLLGRFQLPRVTFIDPGLLSSLSKRELTSGLGEVIKYGALDEKLLERLETSLDGLFNLDMSEMVDVISSCVDMKTLVVDIDPQDTGIRQALNFGHTIGHGVEEASGFRLSHGEAISVGMNYEGMIGLNEGVFDRNELKRLKEILTRAGLPTEIPNYIDVDEVVRLMRNDKKNTERGSMKISLPDGFGKLFSNGYKLLNVPEEEMRRVIS